MQRPSILQPEGGQAMSLPDNLEDFVHIWTIFKGPKDFPYGFVARLHLAGPGGVYGPTNVAFYAFTLDGIRARIPKGLYQMERADNDDPCIVEIWV